MRKSLVEIKKILKEHGPEMRKQFKVARLGIFGSYARGTATKTSDLDVLVTFAKPVSLFTLSGLKNYLEEITHLKVDVVPVEDLRAEFRNNVTKEVIFV